MKRIIIISVIIFVAFAVFGTSLNSEDKIKTDYIIGNDTTSSVVVVDYNLKRSMKLSHDVWSLDPRLKRNCDLLFEIGGVKYYLIDKKITL